MTAVTSRRASWESSLPPRWRSTCVRLVLIALCLSTSVHAQPMRFIGAIRDATVAPHRGLLITLQVPASMLATVPMVGQTVLLPLPLLSRAEHRRICRIARRDAAYYRRADARVVVECAAMSAVTLAVEVP